MPSRTKPANVAGWRLFVVAFALIGFGFQSYLTQTHIHFAQPFPAAKSKLAASGQVRASGAQQSVPNDKAPADDDPLKCPLCQAVGYAGHFVTPSAAALLLPITTISILPLASAIRSSRETSSHIWQGRAPPRS
jgi:hypothetical protein